MSDNEENGAADYGFHSGDAAGRGGEIDDHRNSKSQMEMLDNERDSSRSKEGDRVKGRDKERDRDHERRRDREGERSKERDREEDRNKDRGMEKERDGERHHRSRHRDRSEERGERRERVRGDDDDHRRSRDRDFGRRRDYDRDRGDRRRRRSRSRSKGRSERRSRSPSKSKRVSGFDKPPAASGMLDTGAAVTGQVPAPNQTLPNMFAMPTGQPFGGLPMMPIHAMTQQATRHARRVYVGGLSPLANEQSVATFFSHVMAAVGGNTAGPGITFLALYHIFLLSQGAPVKVRRPSDYNPSLAATLGPSHPIPNLNLAAVGLTPGASGALEGPERLFVGGLPYQIPEPQIRELLESLGALKGFDLVKDRETGNSKGYAFCAYQDPAVTDVACAALNGISMGDKTLTVRRANQGTTQKPEQESVLLHAQQQVAFQRIMLQQGTAATKVVCLTQVVTEEELRDDEEYEEIVVDMREEGGKFGALTKVVIPRPSNNGEATQGVGKVFLEYSETESSSRARNGMNGRKFGGNQVVAVFYPEDKFEQGDYSL
ncbi:unnamed protein product [Thlaspi arvense]|uniref:Splicing factor U2af large subunit n=1 Tax=Thlaspi arvense TaxID=13288 RepID=A0AAU9RXU8_THLAR|nr:unnamed protein product [Thlaspi arvense]